MTYKEAKNRVIKFIICMMLIFISLYVASFFYENDEEKIKVTHEVVKSTISDSNEEYTINVNYPRLNNDKVNETIMDYVYSYVKQFKENDTIPKSLFMNYELYFNENYINIVFLIDNSLSKQKYSNLVINTINGKKSSIEDMFDIEFLKSRIDSISESKYPYEVSSMIKSSNLDYFTYIINDNKIKVYFNLDFKDIDYDPFITIDIDDEQSVFEENEYNENSKFIAFTFDDGPSENTKEILKTLELNNASATFFMLGNKLKHNEEIVIEVYNSNSEIGSHTYSHKYLTKLSGEALYNEFNSTSILFNEITSGVIEYLRPPYGSYNDEVKENSPYPLILWNIDTKDWLHKDSDKTYNTIIDNACDGCIVLMHDTYDATVEAVKKVVPSLRAKGYEVVSISELAKQKNIELIKGITYRSISN